MDQKVQEPVGAVWLAQAENGNLYFQLTRPFNYALFDAGRPRRSMSSERPVLLKGKFSHGLLDIILMLFPGRSWSQINTARFERCVFNCGGCCSHPIDLCGVLQRCGITPSHEFFVMTMFPSFRRQKYLSGEGGCCVERAQDKGCGSILWEEFLLGALRERWYCNLYRPEFVLMSGGDKIDAVAASAGGCVMPRG